MIKKPYFEWDEETGSALCILYYNDKVFIGQAKCHPDDIDMCSEKTGQQIALMRAEINYLNHLKNNEIIPALKALNQFYYSINKSKKFNEKSYEVKMLKRQIKLYNLDYEILKNEIKEKKLQIKTYIQAKDNFYNKIRKNRKKHGQNI